MSGIALIHMKLQLTKVLLHTLFPPQFKHLEEKWVFSGLDKQLLFLKDQNTHRSSEES